MTSQQYIEAVRAMVGLPPAYIEHLVRLAEKLTDVSRKEAIESLTPVHEEILQEQKLAEEDLEKAEKELEHLEKVEIPEMRNEIEKQEHAYEEAAAYMMLNPETTPDENNV